LAGQTSCLIETPDVFQMRFSRSEPAI
jgi:hypothetical protein